MSHARCWYGAALRGARLFTRVAGVGAGHRGVPDVNTERIRERGARVLEPVRKAFAALFLRVRAAVCYQAGGTGEARGHLLHVFVARARSQAGTGEAPAAA